MGNMLMSEVVRQSHMAVDDDNGCRWFPKAEI